MLPIITKIENKASLQNILETNPGVIIIKFGATWCEPCKIIEEDVHNYLHQMPDNVQSYVLDVDDNIEIYGFLKSKKMVKGIPAILAYYQDNTSHIPDEFVNGTKKEEIKYFFDMCIDNANS
jgi:thiol:disulfide interchange protein